MSLTGSFVVFIILWWLILFMILPRDINSQKNNDFVVKGTDPRCSYKSKYYEKTHNNYNYYLNIICDHLFFKLF